MKEMYDSWYVSRNAVRTIRENVSGCTLYNNEIVDVNELSAEQYVELCEKQHMYIIVSCRVNNPGDETTHLYDAIKYTIVYSDINLRDENENVDDIDDFRELVEFYNIDIDYDDIDTIFQQIR